MTEKKAPQEVKFLDLDALTPDVAVSITLNNESHAMAEMTVKDFVWAQKLAGEQDKLDPDTMSEKDYERVMGRMVDVLSRQFPTAGHDAIANLPITKLSALMKFVGSLGAEGAAVAVAEAAESGNVELVETKETADQS